MKRVILGIVVAVAMSVMVPVIENGDAVAGAAPAVSRSIPVTTADLSAFKAAFIRFKLHYKEMLSTDRIAWGRVRSRKGLVRAEIAYDATDHREWAFANFNLVLPASMKAEISFQDGGSYGIFNRVGSGAWFMIGEPGIPLCAKEFPAVVARLWGMDTYATC
jgi:hypothetical protein